jgi:negative regulator of genetic competence, sporulation and motility
MTYSIGITYAGTTHSIDYENIDDVLNIINGLATHYGQDNLVAISDDPFVAIKFKDIEQITVLGVSRTELREYAQYKMAKEQAEKMAAYQSQVTQGSQLNYPNTSGLDQCESANSRLL